MLNSFPFEIIEEILFYLPVRDRLNLVRTCRRFYDIGHSEKLRVKGTTNGSFAVIDQLVFLSYRQDETFDEEDHPISASTHSIYLSYCYCDSKSSVHEEYHIGITVGCCLRHYDVNVNNCENSIHGDMWKSPRDFFTKHYGKDAKQDYLQLHYRTIDEAIKAASDYLWFLSNVYSAVLRLEFEIEGSMILWNKIKSYFEFYDIALHKIALQLSGVSFECYDLYSSRVFNRGIDKLFYDDNVVEHYLKVRDFEVYEKVFKAECADIKFTDDARLLHFEGNRELNLCEAKCSSNAIACYLKKIFDNWQHPKLSVTIGLDMAATIPRDFFTLSVSLLPENTYEFLDFDRLKFTNKFGQEIFMKLIKETKLSLRSSLIEAKYNPIVKHGI